MSILLTQTVNLNYTWLTQGFTPFTTPTGRHTVEQVSSIPKAIDDLTRSEKLTIYLRRMETSFAAISKTLGISRGGAIRLLKKSKTIPSWRHRQFRELGIPEELLPVAKDIAPGRKPKAPQSSNLMVSP